ncbi:hypothetical protein SETIT_6G035100v2 [Setaria italica]|uniref:Solanesyl diphosphate synthase n=1 Tax=Setaria italica TaxID=4555 RepID=A0A368RHV1_SETIT|nr:hypothetical protein SETIT_6G035100v2 [Setaria italica]
MLVQHGLLFAEDILQDSCKAIAVFAEQTTEVQALAYQYGRHLGIAYQLIDDILNFTGTSASLGKASLSDIHQGIVTAPIPFAMEEFPELREIVEQGFDDPLNVKTESVLFFVSMWPSNTFQKVRESRGRGLLLLNMQNWQRALSMIFLIVRIKLCLTRGKRSKI